MRYWTKTRFLALAGTAMAASDSWALDPRDLLLYQNDSLSLKPQVTVSETFNDNIFYGDDRTIAKESDLITTISPGINLTYGDQRFNFIDFTYNYDQLLYLDNSDQNAGQHRFALLSHVQKRRLTLDGSDQIEFLSSPLGGGVILNQAESQIERWSFRDEYRLTYDYSEKTTPYIEFTHSTIDWQDGIRLYDSTTLIGTLGFGYRAFPRTTLFGEVYYGSTMSSRNASGQIDYPTARFVGGFLGIRGNFTERFTGMVKAGYESRSYSDGESGGGLPVVETSLTYQFTEKTIATLAYSRRQRESVQVFAGERSAFTSQIISANLLQHIGNEGRFRANLKAAYHMSEYDPLPNFDRDDDMINAGLALTYDFKLWLRGFISYDFEHLDSTYAQVIDYNVNRVTLGLTLGY